MGYSDDFTADIIVYPVERVCVDEAVPDPETSFNSLVYFAYDLDGQREKYKIRQTKIIILIE